MHSKVLADLLAVVDWLGATKSPSREAAAALERLRIATATMMAAEEKQQSDGLVAHDDESLHRLADRIDGGKPNDYVRQD